MKKVKVNYLFIIFTFLCFLTGLYKEYLIFLSIIIIHELGHYISALILKWNIISINLNVYGGNIIFDNLINKPLIESFFVSISGVVLQTIYFFIIFTIYKFNLISDNYFIMFKNYHFIILIFNLLPIYPLDGSKIINIIVNMFFPYKYSHKLSIFFSSLTLIFFLNYLLIKRFNTNGYIILVLLVIKTLDEIRNHNYLFNKFLLERYIYKLKFTKKKHIKKSIKNMYMDYEHIFYINKEKISEEKVLNNHFKN